MKLWFGLAFFSIFNNLKINCLRFEIKYYTEKYEYGRLQSNSNRGMIFFLIFAQQLLICVGGFLGWNFGETLVSIKNQIWVRDTTVTGIRMNIVPFNICNEIIIYRNSEHVCRTVPGNCLILMCYVPPSLK